MLSSLDTGWMKTWTCLILHPQKGNSLRTMCVCVFMCVCQCHSDPSFWDCPLILIICSKFLWSWSYPFYMLLFSCIHIVSDDSWMGFSIPGSPGAKLHTIKELSSTGPDTHHDCMITNLYSRTGGQVKKRVRRNPLPSIKMVQLLY